MLIKRDEPKFNKDLLFFLFKNLKNFKFLIISIFFISYSFLLILVSSSRENRSFIASVLPLSTKHFIQETLLYNFIKGGLKTNVPLNYLSSLSINKPPLIIDIKYKDFAKIENKREDSIKRGFLQASSDDFVNAKISYLDKTYRSKIRLKGDWPSHWAGEKWSFRAKLRDGKSLFGMRKFSLHSPSERNYLHEWIFHRLQKKEDLPGLKYSFLPVVINGKNAGIYAIEEHFDKVLLESNKYKEGPIFKLSDGHHWQKMIQHKELKGPFSNYPLAEEYDVFRSHVDTFQLNKTIRNPVLKTQMEKGLNLLSFFYEGELSTSEVFDTETLAKYFALMDLTNGHHSFRWHNHRFYYNPIISKLIPIGFDALGGDKNNNLIINIYGKDSKFNFFEDNKFTTAYVKYLEKYSETRYLDEFFSNSQKELNDFKKLIYKSYPAMSFTKNNYYYNQQYIKTSLNPPDPLNAYIREIDESKIIVTVGNKQQFPLEIESIRSSKNGIIYYPKEEYTLPGKNHSKFASYKDYIFVPDNKNKILPSIDSLSINYKIIGSNNLRSKKVSPYQLNLKTDSQYLYKYSDLTKYQFIDVNKEKLEIILKEGEWSLDTPLILPPNYAIKAMPGFSLQLRNNSFIVSNSPLFFNGKKDKPIRFFSNKTSDGLGIFVLNAKKKSYLNNVIFEGLTNPSIDDWSVTGAVTFYESPLIMKNIFLANSRCEDALNIVRSDFSMENITIVNSKSDSFDIDFSNGSINNLVIRNSGNDGLDISGSDVNANNILIFKSGDKAISIGENSQFSGSNLEVKDAEIAITSKDLSTIDLKDVFIYSSRLGLTAFEKKSEYGGGKINITNLKIDKTKEAYLLEPGSSITVNSVDYKFNVKEVFSLLYGNEYGKKS